ncbi:DMT family transporter [Halorussus sp. MSC15.2]|uniref:DMT family transporter n=1 Tax=Halorussus sp. MSC15.2 TaxID=2283638 RepID=UPI0013D75BE9|nr:DMT family transporter [Halorussus sp. MSC15.2]NEU56908.1 DMT family transporter [Halorussus sp. MSC15.2]
MTWLATLEERTPPMAALAVSVVAISTSAILVRFSDAPSVVKALYRVVFTTLLLAPFTVTHYRDDLRALSVSDALVAVVTGVALAAHFAAWFESLEWTTVAASVTLVQSQPLFVALGAALLLDETINRRMVAGIVVSVAGVAFMSLGGLLSGAALAGARPLYGDALALVGAVMAAGYVLAGRSLRQRVALVPYVTVVYSVCAVALLAVALAEGVTVAPTAYPPEEWLLFLAMAVGPGIFGHTVINWALKYVESSVVSVTLLGEPVGSTLLALVLLSEAPDVFTVTGGAVVLAGIYVTARARPSGA